MMRILYIANVRMPTEKAHGAQIIKTCEAFVEEGAEVHLLVPRRKNKGMEEDPFLYYGAKNTFPITYLSGVDLVSLGRIGFLIQTALFSFVAVMRALVTRYTYVYSRDEAVLYFLSFFTRRFVWESHSGKQSFTSKRVMCRAKSIVVISEGLKNFYVAHGIDASRIVVAHDAVDSTSFISAGTSNHALRTQYGISATDTVILYAGRLDGWKGSDTFLEAVASLEAPYKGVVVGGEEWQINTLKTRYPNIIFMGAVPYRDLASYQAVGDILVLPNTGKDRTSTHFTSPMKLFTYCASGKPIIASDLPSIREILDEKTAYFVIPDDAKVLREKILEVGGDTERHVRGLEARVKALAYTWNSRAKTILSKLQKLSIVFVTYPVDTHGGWGRYVGGITKGLKALGHDVSILSHQSPIDLISSIRKASKTADIVHAIDMNPFGFYAWAGTLGTSAKLFISAQGTYSVAPLCNIKTRIPASLIFRMARTIAISHFTQKEILVRVPSARVSVVTHGIDQSLIPKQAGERVTPHYILSVGAIKPRKGHEASIRAFARIHKDFRDSRYRIVGSLTDAVGYVEHLKKIVKELGIEEQVMFEGVVSDEVLAELYRGASVFVLVSENDKCHFEGFGLVFLEAGAYGVPGIGTKGNGIEDALYQGETGILVSQGNIEEIGKAMGALLGDKELHDRLGGNARKQALARPWEVVAKEYEKIYIS